MGYATTTGREKTVAELAHRLYGVAESSAEGREAAKALKAANPELRRIADLPRGTVIEVPAIDLEPRTPLLDFPELAGSVVVEGARDDLDDLRESLDALATGRVDDAVRSQRRLNSKAVKRAARRDDAFAEHVDRMAAEIQDELDESRAWRDEQRRAMTLLAEDLDELSALFDG